MSLHKQFITLTAVITMTLASAAYAADAATVNGKPIKESWVNFIIKDAKARGQKGEGLKRAVINELVGSELVYQEAAKNGFHKKADVAIAAEIGRRKLIVNAFLADYMKKNPASEADKKEAYEQYKKEIGKKEYKAKHILVATEAEAKTVINELGKGGDFAKIAKSKSKDPGSKTKGGDLGWFSPSNMVAPFSEAVTQLKKGATTTEPVQTQFGWHVIKLIDSRLTKIPTYEKVKDGLERTLQQRKLEKLMLSLKEKAKIVVPNEK